MEIKTRIPKLNGEDISSYINAPVLDKFSRTIHFNDDINIITDNDDSRAIGVIKDAQIIGNEVELIIELFDEGVQRIREYLNDKVISFSISQ